MLDLAKAELGTIELYRTNFSFPDLLRRVDELIRIRAERRGIAFQLASSEMNIPIDKREEPHDGRYDTKHDSTNWKNCRMDADFYDIRHTGSMSRNVRRFGRHVAFVLLSGAYYVESSSNVRLQRYGCCPQAFAHAVDRDAIAALYENTAEPTTNILVSPSKYDSPNTAKLYPFDLQRAAELLDAAGWHDTDGDGIRDRGDTKMSVVFQSSVNTIRQQTQEIVKNALEQRRTPIGSD